MTPTSDPTIYQRPAEIAQALIRFDTTNPPGNEAACIAYIRQLLADAGIPVTILARDPARPNLIARLPGQGTAPPLLLQGHIDVVNTANQPWQHPPFAGEVIDGYLWGRGALDMKGGVAMMLAAMLRARAEGEALAGDVVLACVSDEENFGEYGAGFLVAEHPDLFSGIRYALGEFGGFPFDLGGRRFYPIMVAEKQSCRVFATVRGPAGHGSRPMRGGAMARLARMLTTLDTHRLPVHITPVGRLMIEEMAAVLPAPLNARLPALLDPAQTDALLDRMGPEALGFDPLLHNTVNATIVHGGTQTNVIPSKIVVEMDGRTLPGFSGAALQAELVALLGDEVEIAVQAEPPTAATPDMGLFPTLSAILREADPEALPIPYMLPAVTDGRYFTRLGIQTYGFLPMNLPEDFDFYASIHAADERVPVEALDFGADAVYKVLQRFGAAENA
jgi:acetylornithine deacetylase/succinyl-diaminopimelate desuccinylase-like protein